MKLLLTATCLLAAIGYAQQGSTSAAAPAPKPKPCTAPEFRQFDFWVGTWDVEVKGKIVGENFVTKEQDGCLIVEHWRALRQPSTGSSFNYYDVSDKKWHQLYIANNGIAQSFPPIAGTFADGKMTLVNEEDPKNSSRWSWTAMPDGRVRQMAVQSTDGGKTWTTVWDSLYYKRLPQSAKGTFDVKTTPHQESDEIAKAANAARLTIDKVFHGDLEGTSKGQMLGAQSEVKGSAGYVAMERVTGTLNGKKGSFVLQHKGAMDHGTQSLDITVVPDSGTEDLKGLTGSMKISVDGDKHSYVFDYAIAKQ
jgi:hypothetical protein